MSDWRLGESTWDRAVSRSFRLSHRCNCCRNRRDRCSGDWRRWARLLWLHLIPQSAKQLVFHRLFNDIDRLEEVVVDCFAFTLVDFGWLGNIFLDGRL